MQCFNKAAKKEVRAVVVLIIAQNKSFKLCTEMGRTEDKLTLLFLDSATYIKALRVAASHRVRQGGPSSLPQQGDIVLSLRGTARALKHLSGSLGLEL